MNAMDLIPVDLLPKLADMAGIHYLKVVPTTDPHTTFAIGIINFHFMYLLQCKNQRFWRIYEIVYGSSFWYLS
jgi:F-type H+-transporting ATPase subunit a